MKYSKNWRDYELIDAGDGEKLEKWGKYILKRPDPQAIWSKNPNLQSLWNSASKNYERSSTGGGKWVDGDSIPEKWVISYGEMKILVKPTGFKHTGVFPEQAYNWNCIIDAITIKKKELNREIKVLNLFAYTGGATIASIYAGAHVCHVDSSKQILTTANENIEVNNFDKSKIRFIAEDALSFVKKEIRRGNKYDVIIMDPPTFGRGDKGQVWKIEQDIYPFIKYCAELLSNESFMFLVNTYVSSLSGKALENILNMEIVKKYGGQIEYDEIGIPITMNQPNKQPEYILPAGIFARWYKK